MTKQRFISLLLIVLSLGACSDSSRWEQTSKPDTEQTPEPDKKPDSDEDIFTPEQVEAMMKLPIKELVAELYDKNLYLGIANRADLIGELSDQIALREFSYITPTNDFKQPYIYKELGGEFRYEKCDSWIAHANEHNLTLRSHGPISPQCSSWVMDDSRTAEELTEMLETYMKALCERYANEPSLRWMDVVNETIATRDITDNLYGTSYRGDWFGPREGDEKWQNPWTIIGYDEQSDIRTPLYIDMAFKISNEYAPRIKQIINQHGDFEEPEWERMKELVKYLRANGRRVDGVGWQAHIDCGWEKIEGNLERLDNFIAWCHSNSLEFHITEMNVWILDGDVSKESEQAKTYGAVMSTMLRHVDTGVVGLNFWNVRDEDTKNYDQMGCLWRNDGTARPGYDAIKMALIEHRNSGL